MKRNIALLAPCLVLSFACDVEDIPEEELNDVNLTFREGPVFEGSESWDKCCPKLDGEVVDYLCVDDIGNSCSHVPLDGTEGWYIVNCNTCGANSPHCSGTRWTNHAFGAECDAFATRKYTNAIVDDDCRLSACSGAGTFNELSSPAGVPVGCVEDTLGSGGAIPNDRIQTNAFDGSLSTMCCKSGEWTDCIPKVGGNCGSTGASGDPHDYFYERWCSPCSGQSSSHATLGAWDLAYDGASDEWLYSVVCENIWYDGASQPSGAANSITDLIDVFATHYDCGGYAFAEAGVLINDNCD